MTNGELIEFLQQFPKDIPVYVNIAYCSDIKAEHVNKGFVEEAILIERADD